MTNPLKTGPWKLTDLKDVKPNGLKVFSCFHCGGGSTMGYKLAGYEVLGGVEIDPKMMDIYKTNHNPKYSYLMGVQDFKNLTDLPKELFDLDILDGSPPCSSFSMAGSREKAWGKNKKFREGQSEQVLDDLFFEFIAIASKLKPKVVIAENVKGLISGNAKGYVKQIFEALDSAGYSTQLFLFDASTMGVPQRRHRVFFIARRKDLIGLEPLKLEFNEPYISVSTAFEGLDLEGRPATPFQTSLWRKTAPGQSFSKIHPKGSWFNSIKLHPKTPAGTLAASGGAGGLYHYSEPRKITDRECLRLQTFPDDFDLKSEAGQYLCGMSVPPFMTQRIADQIERQWFTKPTVRRRSGS